MSRRPVEVLHEGRWLPADLLSAYRDKQGHWWAVVEYAAAPGERYHQSRPESEVRRVGPDRAVDDAVSTAAGTHPPAAPPSAD